MKWLAGFRKKVIEGWTVQRIAALLIVVGLVVFVVGAITQYCTCSGWPNLGDVLNHMIGDFYANVSVDCLSIAFAILVIDRLNERRAEKELKAQLIREMGSTDNGIAVRATRELEIRGWTRDGSLVGVNLAGANLQGARLSFANLQGATLISANLERVELIGAKLQDAKMSHTNLQRAELMRANLRHANLQGADLQLAYLTDADLFNAKLDFTYMPLVTGITAAQLATAQCLMGATMPDGSRYNGCFNLKGDLYFAVTQLNRNIDDAKGLADMYGVPLDVYLRGQTSMRENLQALHYDPRLWLEVARSRVSPLPMLRPQMNGVLSHSQPTHPRPAPRRNGHKASIVAHRVRR